MAEDVELKRERSTVNYSPCADSLAIWIWILIALILNL